MSINNSTAHGAYSDEHRGPYTFRLIYLSSIGRPIGYEYTPFSKRYLGTVYGCILLVHAVY